MNFKDSLPWEIKGVRPGEQADELGVKRGFQVLRVGEIDLNENTKKQVMLVHFYHRNALCMKDVHMYTFLTNGYHLYCHPKCL